MLSEAQLEQRRRAAPRGGAATVAKYGREYMKELARLGGRAFWQKYKLVPIAINNFAIVYRSTGELTGSTMTGEHLPVRETTESDVPF